ncbi:RND family transporter [Catenovulum sp. SM1970]|uniref:efflux RND transporter permease subunit n=1 Tax=Marinifaba aquimaris TaxID=2741323 RepID=UPI0015745A48|nr:MMPL family transporter [Marinifaba aquimaris]NTS76007.1 RND family transporter [Marinifaba aquimaris]
MSIFSIINFVEQLIFRHRQFVILFFALMTCVLGYQASQIKLDAAFTKNIPLKHEYMQTYLQYQQDFGGANNVLISLCDSSGDIYNPAFFDSLKKVHDQLFFIQGVSRSSVKSLFSPSVRFTQVVEDGFAGGPVIPANFKADNAGLNQVKRNVELSGQVGRIVANDYSCAMVSAQLLEFDPQTGESLDTIKIAKELENTIRGEFETDSISVHIIGFAKMVGDVAAGAKGVILFFIVAIIITTLFVYYFCKSLKLTLFPIACSLIAMIWKVGILSSLGFGIDPMSILLPFLIFAIGVSHGVQMINAVVKNLATGSEIKHASQQAFKVLALPGLIALVSDCIGFLTILSIDIGIIKELAISASIGVGVIILTNLILMPVALSFVKDASLSRFLQRQQDAQALQQQQTHCINRGWQKLHAICKVKNAALITALSFVVFVVCYGYSNNLKVGDLHAGAPALHTDSRYNQDTFLITEKYAVSVDILSIIAESEPDACTQFDTMSAIDDFQWRLSNVEGVQSSVSLTSVAKIINSGFNEANPKWRVLSSNVDTLAQSVARVPTSSGLLNGDCSAIPIILFLTDHKAETMARVIDVVKVQKAEFESEQLTFRLASGPAGVMAATNEAVTEAQVPMMLYVYGAVIILCLLSFKSIKATIAVVLPLYLVSIMAQALMTYMQIGLTVYTLPVIALGVGIGVDYGIYILTTMNDYIRRGESIERAYIDALKERGGAVIFTGITLAVGVSTWLFSDLKFQVDMGILLTFMFLLNMLGAIILLPALVRLMWPKQ